MQPATMPDARPYILVVDDTPAHAEAVRRALEAAGLDLPVQTGGTLREYHDLVAVHPPEVAIVDINLPDGTALEVLASPVDDGDFPVVVMTSFGSEQLAVEAMKAGALDYVVKSPEAFAAMPRTIERVLRQWNAIQERKRAEEALRLSQERFKAVANYTVDWESWFGPDGKYLWVNPSVERITGYSAEEILAMPDCISILVAEEDKARVRAAFQDALRGVSGADFEARYLHRNGSKLWLDVSWQRIFDSQGNGLGVRSSARDITARKRAEVALRESEEKFRSMAEQIVDAMFVLDTEGTILYTSPSASLMCGWTAEELAGRHFTKFLSEDEIPKAMAAIQTSVASGKPARNLALALKRKDGSPFRGDLSGSVVREDGRVVGLLGILRDVTERERAQDALRESEERFRSLVATILDAVLLTTPEGEILSANAAACEMFGYAEEELLRVGRKAVVDATDPRLQAAFEERARTGRFHGEVTLVRRDGTKFPSEISSATFCVREGQSRNSMVIRDITARKKAEERERLARETLDLLGRSEGAEETIRAILAAVKTTTGFDAVAIRLRDGNDFPYYVTRGFPEEFVLAERFLCARDRAGEILRDGEGNPVLECLCGDILCGRTNPALPFFTRGGSFWANSTTKLLDMTTELDPPARMRNVCNSYGYESVALIPLRAGAEIIGLLQLNDHRPNQLTPEMVHFFEGLGASIGIALARRRAAIESEKLQAQFLQAQKMESVGRLAGGVAHDFNNLLTVINGYSELLLRKVHVGDPMREGLEEIHRAGGRAAGLTQQLLAYSRRQMLQPRSINLDRVVSEMEPMLARLVGEDVELCVEMHSEGAMIFADPHQLGQVLMNLAVNSRDAMPGGGRLSIHTAVVERSESDAQAHPEAHAGQYVMLSVSDTGEGMNEETRQKVFEPFFTTKGADKGTGLGLSMVHGIVHQSRGHIEIHSEPGCGTTFQIYLPRVEGLAADSGELDATPVSAIGGKETVLVVEDTAEVRKFAASALQPYGYRVIQAENAEEAMLLCERKRERIDLVLTDVVMPQVSGRVLAERLEKLQPGIKVLFMSGYSDDITSHHGVLAEGVKLIQKPFTAEQLATKVREVLGSAEGKGPTILVVDDFAAIRSLIAETLSTAGYAVLEACDGVQARELLREHEVQLVLMDINMPTQGGLGAARQIRGQHPEIKIILMSASFEGTPASNVAVPGADGVLPKPVEPEVLLETVRRLLA